MRFLASLRHQGAGFQTQELTGDSFCRWRKETAGQGSLCQCHLTLTSTPPTLSHSHQRVPWPCKLIWVICPVSFKVIFSRLCVCYKGLLKWFVYFQVVVRDCLIWRWINNPCWAFGGRDIDAEPYGVIYLGAGCLKGIFQRKYTPLGTGRRQYHCILFTLSICLLHCGYLGNRMQY